MADPMNGPITRCPWCSAELSIPGAESCLACGATLVGAPGTRFTRVHSDTRTLREGDLFVALKGENAFGLLAMASEDARRFYPEMGTLYLKRIGELVSVALLRHIL